MAVNYQLDEENGNMHTGEGKVKGLYPRVISKRTVFLDELLKKKTTPKKGTEANMNDLPDSRES